jgi:hypothetical protein
MAFSALDFEKPIWSKVSKAEADFEAAADESESTSIGTPFLGGRAALAEDIVPQEDFYSPPTKHRFPNVLRFAADVNVAFQLCRIFFWQRLSIRLLRQFYDAAKKPRVTPSEDMAASTIVTWPNLAFHNPERPTIFRQLF